MTDFITVVLHWYVYLFILGIIFIPITSVIFRKMPDLGLPFAKIIGLLALSYAAFVLGLVKLVPYERPTLFAFLMIFIAINIIIFKKNGFRLKDLNFKLLLFEELLFLIGLIFWSFVRSQEPSIRGLEKFMDYGFMNSILRAKFFPPQDMWLAGKSINYYYFGHLMGATLTKLSGIAPQISYGLLLATIFALAVSQSFSLAYNIFLLAFKKMKLAITGALLAVFLINLGGNLHTIYSFTKGYPNDKPVAPWEINDPKIGCNKIDESGKQNWTLLCPGSYWYPNATRFIPLTIHEFPIYSYVVADLHGHVFDIPVVLLTLAILYLLFSSSFAKATENKPNNNLKLKTNKLISTNFNQLQLILTIFLGFLAAVHYMTNAFDGPIYLLLTTFILFYIYRIHLKFAGYFIILVFSFIVFSLPFSVNFNPFVSGIGVNCPLDQLTTLKKLGPFIFEKGNCQISAWWMLLILWGFFLFNFLFLFIRNYRRQNHEQTDLQKITTTFILIIFSFGTMLILIPEFFYIKDIYPAHFRANTMFKLGYQSFMMMSLASAYALIFFKNEGFKKITHKVYLSLFTFLFILVAIYPFYAINSFYGNLRKAPNLDGSTWINGQYSEYQEIIKYLNDKITGQPIILEAQGDSYTDYNVVSSYTGLPTVAGWLVHQWLWRGSADVVSVLSPKIQTIYESSDLNEVGELIKRFHIKYVIIGSNEKTKYPNLTEDKFKLLGKEIFVSKSGTGKIYELRQQQK
ncbi:hypothetical protein A3J15_03705 [Candidatus Roizmanbacteria bacterium RIFCSPLOWO2_02_FULL_38_10]|uniref:YYY membrane protein n=1 Tax=Candidatus Roizmanbacteria bacterium RIFCSPLOWO2_02_FULL_38_10 TaxID=1802074 RepID=A0A1F7JNA2_9BACT|nr:MAG: hypothetical protein A3J15_03705 [Candidatus Roizmanbacteria bacterium RIFCSPLOWO2_02_FULL_38_10]